MADHNLIEELILRRGGGGLSIRTGKDELKEHDRCPEHRAGRQVLGQLLEGCDAMNPGSTTRCRWCGMEANYVSRRPGYVSTCFGAVRYRRAHYVCPNCYHSTYPLDERLDPNASLARLRKRLADGVPLPVGEIARAWGLGTLNISHVKRIAGSQSGGRASARNRNPMQGCIDARTIQ